MNRAETRRQKRANAKADKVYHLTKSQLDKIVAEATNKALKKELMEYVEQNFIVMMALPSVALHDVFGFGKARLIRFIDNVITKYECMLDDYDHKRRDGYEFDTFMDILKQETEFDVLDYLERRKIIKRGDKK